MKKGFKITVLYGSVRSSRQGIKAAKWIVKKLEERGHKVTLVDPMKVKLPLLNKRYKDYPKGKAPAKLEKLAKLYRKTDAFVVVSAEYNHSIPPALSNLIDYFLEEYYWRPSAIVCYSAGGFGGVRASIQLRAMLAEVGMSSIPATFPISKVQDSFDAKGNALDKSLEERIGAFIDQLEWYAAALRKQRKKGVPY